MKLNKEQGLITVIKIRKQDRDMHLSSLAIYLYNG